jgi:multiple sugar transport system substrate-binding protein
MKNTRMTGLKWASALLATALATGFCAGAQAETIKIMGWIGLFDFQKPGWEKMVTTFEAQNPGVKIEYIGTPFEDTLNQATVAILGKNAPDIIQVASGWVPQLSAMKALEPLSDYLPADEIAKFPKVSLAAATVNSKVEALDWLPGPIAMGYNRTLMKKAGLDPDLPPKTWDEFTKAVDKICALGGSGDGKIYGVSLRTARHPNSAQWSIPFIWSNGGTVVDKAGKVSFNNEGVRKAYEWYRDVIRRGCSQEAFDIQASRSVFAQGRAGFIFEGPWLRGLVEKLSGGKLKVAKDGDVWIAPMPTAADGKVRQIENSNMLVLTKQAKDKKLAAKFISFLLGNTETVEYFYKTSQQLTTGRLDLLTTGDMGKDPYIQSFVDALPVSDPIPINNPQWNAVMDAVSPSLQSIIQGADAKTELSNADREIDRILGQ